MTIEHQQYGRPCPCDIAEVTEREAQFLELMDNWYGDNSWYGDKSYRCHSEWLEILRSITDADMSAVQDQAWSAGFDACSERLVDVSKRLTVLELLCSGAAHRGQDEKFQARWAWYKNLPMVDAFKGSGIDKAVLIAILEDNEPQWTAGDDLSAGWQTCVNYIAKHF